MTVRKPIRRSDERKAAYNMAREILRNPRLRHQLTRKHPRLSVQVHIEEERKKEAIDMTPEKKRLTKNEKLAILDELAGSADNFSPEGVLETIRIANKEDWEEETK